MKTEGLICEGNEDESSDSARWLSHVWYKQTLCPNQVLPKSLWIII